MLSYVNYFAHATFRALAFYRLMIFCLFFVLLYFFVLCIALQHDCPMHKLCDRLGSFSHEFVWNHNYLEHNDVMNYGSLTCRVSFREIDFLLGMSDSYIYAVIVTINNCPLYLLMFCVTYIGLVATINE